MQASPSWVAVAGLVEELLARMDDVSVLVTRQIREEISEYAGVPEEEHVAHVREQQSRMLQAIAAARAPDAEDLDRARRLGRRRATQGISVESVISAYHVGNRELWELLRAEPGDAAPALPEVAALMWRSIHATSTVLAAAHADVTRTLHAEQVTLRHRLVELLVGGSAASGEAADVAGALGFEPAGVFVAGCSDAAYWDGARVDALQQRLDRAPGTGVAARHADMVIAVAQHWTAEKLAAALAQPATGARVGLGAARPGLPGAATSVQDARRALAVTTAAHPVAVFDRDWLAATLLAARDELRPLIEAGLPGAVANPHLRETVRAYAAGRFSVTAAAARLGLHANTVAYRLERWRDATGWDARTLDGLLLSLVASWVVDHEARG